MSLTLNSSIFFSSSSFSISSSLRPLVDKGWDELDFQWFGIFFWNNSTYLKSRRKALSFHFCDFSVFNPIVFPAACEVCELTKWIQNKFSAPCQHKRGKKFKKLWFSRDTSPHHCSSWSQWGELRDQYVQIHVDDCITSSRFENQEDIRRSMSQ